VKDKYCLGCSKELGQTERDYCSSCLMMIRPDLVCEHGGLQRQCVVCELTAEVERLNALLDVASKMHDRLMDERNKLREELAETNAMFKQR
jgi:hypothetical protein